MIKKGDLVEYIAASYTFKGRKGIVTELHEDNDRCTVELPKLTADYGQTTLIPMKYK